MSRRVLFLVDNLPRARFFGRFAPVCHERGIAVQFLAYRLSSHRFLKRQGADTLLLNPRQAANNQVASSQGIHCLYRSQVDASLEVVSGDANADAILKVSSQIANQIKSTIESFSPTHVFMWNGSQLVERLTTKVCPAEISKCYFEIGNLPGKMFADRQGVNAAASLYDSPETLLAGQVPSDAEFESWRTDYVSIQRSRGVPQAKIAQAMQWERPLDVAASKLGFGFYPIGLRPMWKRFVGKLSHASYADSLINEYRRPAHLGTEYRFFPLQVSGDTQLLLNSDVGNLEALKRIKRACQQDQIDLVLKLHPAENNRQALMALKSVLAEPRRGSRVFLSDQPTTELILGAEKVYTINSTVGLEALILGKPLEVLGRAFYQHFIGRPDLLKAYLLRYLISFDYFSADAASSALLDRLLCGWHTVKLRPQAELIVGP